MTQQSVEILIGKLLTDEELREAFEQNPHAVLVGLLRQGLHLSRLEMEALKSLKLSDMSGLVETIDRRLQKASLRRAPMTHAVRDTDTLPTAALGTTGMRITRVGFGAWAIGGGGWTFAWGNQDDTDSIAAIRHAIERGINWIDTAAVYGLGHSEEIVARALRDIPADDRPYVFTKAGLVWDERDRAAPPRRVGDPLSLRHEVEGSLRRLDVERIDLYQMHWPAEDGTALEDYWGTLLQLKEEGKVRASGSGTWIRFSRHSRRSAGRSRWRSSRGVLHTAPGSSSTARCSPASSRATSASSVPPGWARTTGAPALPTLRASGCAAMSAWRTRCGPSRSVTAQRSPP